MYTWYISYLYTKLHICVYASILNYWLENSCCGSTSLNQTFSLRHKIWPPKLLALLFAGNPQNHHRFVSSLIHPKKIGSHPCNSPCRFFPYLIPVGLFEGHAIRDLQSKRLGNLDRWDPRCEVHNRFFCVKKNLIPGTINNRFLLDVWWNTNHFWIKIWFIIQLKQPLKNGCLGYQVYNIFPRKSKTIKIRVPWNCWLETLTKTIVFTEKPFNK